MPSFSSLKRRLRTPFLVSIGLFSSLFVLAQVNLTYRLLTGYALSTDAPVAKGKPTLFVFEQADTFSQVFQLTGSGSSRKRDAPNFDKEMSIGIVLPSTKKPPKLSVSRLFVQDSTLTVRYIRVADTTLTNAPLPESVNPVLLVMIPKQTVLKTKLVENGKVVQTITKRGDQ